MPSISKLFPLLDRILNSGVKDGEDIQTIRLTRQVNGLNLFFIFVATSVTIIFSLMQSSMELKIIQAVATLLYGTSLYLNSKGMLKVASNLTIYVFEVHIFGVMLLTNGWHSAAITLIILYPLLAALVEVSIKTHFFIGIAEAAVLFIINKAFPGLDARLIELSNIGPQAKLSLEIMAVTYTPGMAAVIIGIIFRENMKAREKQKEMLVEISKVNRKLEIYANELKDEAHRLKAEVSIAKKIQTMVLPSVEEIKKIDELDIACIMRTATEVGGDYYDVIKIDGSITIGIGDVTGHGLSSGLIMLMAQTAIRTLAEMKVKDPRTYLSLLNKILYANINRIKEDRSMTLIIVTYVNNRYYISGQHESILICRNNGEMEVIDTMDNGFYVGMTLEIPDTYRNIEVLMEKGDAMLLYSDGVTEATNEKNEQFGIARLSDQFKKYHDLGSEKIRDKIMKDLYNYMGDSEIFDDISLVVIKQK